MGKSVLFWRFNLRFTFITKWFLSFLSMSVYIESVLGWIARYFSY